MSGHDSIFCPFYYIFSAKAPFDTESIICESFSETIKNQKLCAFEFLLFITVSHTLLYYDMAGILHMWHIMCHMIHVLLNWSTCMHLLIMRCKYVDFRPYYAKVSLSLSALNLLTFKVKCSRSSLRFCNHISSTIRLGCISRNLPKS